MDRNDYQAILIVMVGMAVSTLTGFFRHAAIAHQLGAGSATDIFLIAFTVPEFIFMALLIIVPPVFIPLFTDCQQKSGEGAAWHFGLRVAGLVGVGLLLFTLLAELAAPYYLPWLAPGFDRPALSQTMAMMRRMLPAISLMGLAILAGGALQVYRRFARPALTTAVYNLVFIGMLLAGPAFIGPLERAAWGVTLGAGAALLLQLPLVWRYRPRFMAGSDRCEISRVIFLAAPLLAGYAVHHLILLIDRAMATGLGSGNVAALTYAYRLALMVGQVSGLAVSTVLFPRLAEQITRHDIGGARESLSQAMGLVWLLALPASAALIILRRPIIRLLFEHGAFDQAATAAVSGPLIWYAVAVLADALCQPLWRVVYAKKSNWLVLIINGLQTGIRLLANLALTPIFGYNGLALSAAIGLGLQLMILGWVVQQQLELYLTTIWWRQAFRVLLAAAITIVTMVILAQRFADMPPLSLIIQVGLPGALLYLALLWLSGGFRDLDFA